MYLAIGVPEERVLDGTPNDLKPFSYAHKLKCEEADRQAWMSNQYTLEAIMYGLSRLNPKGRKSEYPKKPFMQDMIEKEKEEYLPESDKKKQREQLLMKLKIMQTNFKLSKKDNQGG